jgi:hypothetical protein
MFRFAAVSGLLLFFWKKWIKLFAGIFLYVDIWLPFL